jgi:hypothetical protein
MPFQRPCVLWVLFVAKFGCEAGKISSAIGCKTDSTFLRTAALILLLLSLSASLARAQMVDLNGNAMSDVWEQIYGASALDPNEDTDGDGVPNRIESLAGTDPFDPNSLPKITSFANSISNFTVAIPAAAGKFYQLQSVASLDGTNWTAEAGTNASTSTVISLTASTGLSAKFFRIAISDLDSDGDGLSDWEEIKLGLDPNNKFSNGQLDGNGQQMSDYVYAAGKLGSQNVLTITATDPTANEPDPGQNAVNLGLLTVTRGGFPLTAVTVNLGLGGPGSGFATEGVDHLSPAPLAEFSHRGSFTNHFRDAARQHEFDDARRRHDEIARRPRLFD